MDKLPLIKYKLQALCDKHQTSIAQLITQANILYNCNLNQANIYKKLTNNTIRYCELELLLNVIGYSLEWCNSDLKPFKIVNISYK